MKTLKKGNVIRTPACAPDDLDWTPMIRAFRDVLEWALDVAAALASDFLEEAEAVERVRRFMRARIAGRPAQVSVDDVLFVFALVLGAIERDLGSLGKFGSWLGVRKLHFPGAPETEARWVAELLATLNPPSRARAFA